MLKPGITLLRFLAAACAATLVVQSSVAQPAASVHLTIHRTLSSLVVSGHTSSAAHESILRDTARRYFGEQGWERITFDLRRAERTPPGWALVTDTTLRALSFTRSATANISPSLVSVRGITETSPAWQTASTRIERSLLPGMHLDDKIVTVSADAAYPEACHPQLAALTEERRVAFSATSAVLRSSSAPLLDAIAELVLECSALDLHIIGHTDATGNETENRALSLERAQAVAAYLVDRGLSEDRLHPTGAGSSQPVARGTNRRARQLNRRVEFRFATDGAP